MNILEELDNKRKTLESNLSKAAINYTEFPHTKSSNRYWQIKGALMAINEVISIVHEAENLESPTALDSPNSSQE